MERYPRMLRVEANYGSCGIVGWYLDDPGFRRCREVGVTVTNARATRLRVHGLGSVGQRFYKDGTFAYGDKWPFCAPSACPPTRSTTISPSS
ncbi:hypothetical protein AB1N83_003644 [Pleurotus pulmonarius]